MKGIDIGKGNDGVGIKNVIGDIVDRFQENAVWKIRRFKNDADRKAGKVYGIDQSMALFGALQNTTIDGNILTNEGINELLTILGSASSGTKFDNTNAYLGVGTGSGAAAASDTESTFTVIVKKGMESGFPTYGTSQKITFKSSFGSSDANQAWNEFGVLNASTSGKLLNRKVSAQGTKVSGQTWELTLEITLS